MILENDPFLAVRKRLDIFERQPYQHKYIDLYLAVDAHARGQERVTSKSNKINYFKWYINDNNFKIMKQTS